MLYFIIVAKSRPRSRGSDPILSTFSELVIESGLLCTVIAITELGLFLGFRGTTYHYAPGLALSKLYSNSMLAVLNARLPLSFLFQSEGQSKAVVSTKVSFTPGLRDGITSTRFSTSRSGDYSSQATSTTRAASYDPDEAIAVSSRDAIELEEVEPLGSDADLLHERRRLRTSRSETELS